jgi:hypothetical protein
MRPYCLRYLKSNGTLAVQHWTNCEGDAEAKGVAMARVPGARQVEVWNGETLIFTRPLDSNAVAAPGQGRQIPLARRSAGDSIRG